MSQILYKYLDIKGAKCMIGNHNLQFTNATRLNDPFDCHPKLLDYSKVVRPVNTYFPVGENYAHKLRSKTWLCSLSKINDSILMWAHYCYNHKGICIGLDLDKVKDCFHSLHQSMFYEPSFLDVQYKEIINRPTENDNIIDVEKYQWETKAKDWEYEKEVRIVIPYALLMEYAAFSAIHDYYSQKVWDSRDIHHYIDLKGECFDSIYFGVNTDEAEKEWIIKYARKMNPQIKLYQMKVDANAFRLNPEEI